MKKIIFTICFSLLFIFSFSSAYSTTVYIAKNESRVKSLIELFKAYKLPPLSGKKVVVKPNFNSNDPFPATTSLVTLEFVIKKLKEAGASDITIAERSGMGDTRKNMEELGVFEFGKKLGVKVVILNELESDEWVKIPKGKTHWLSGFPIPKLYKNADFVVNLPCLKTHRFGGHFTMSLKNNVGVVAKWHRLHNYMWELHMSRSQRKMIAEINKAIPCDLIVMDAMKAFVTEGPEKGRTVDPDLVLLSKDRVAIDAVGVAILRIYGTTEEVMAGKIFDQEQIKRAAEIGVGAKSADQINVVAVNKQAEKTVAKIKTELIK